MILKLPERDWKRLRELRSVALERLCERILGEVAALSAEPSLTWHERYLATYALMQRRDGDITEAFNNDSRSRAIVHLTAMVRMQLVTDEELKGFSEETRETVAHWLAD